MTRIRIFVAHRFDEFKELTDKLCNLAQEHHPGLSLRALADGRADERSARRRSIDEVEGGSDVLLLLLGLTYSSDPDQLSITHEEFRSAQEFGMPVFAYSLADDIIGNAEDPRAVEFLREVQRHRVVGRLSDPRGRDHVGDAARILAHLEDRLQTFEVNRVNAAEGEGEEESFRSAVLRELRELDIMGLQDWQITDTANRGEEARQLERARRALHCFETGRDQTARQSLRELSQDVPLWHTDYLWARLLLSSSGTPRDLRDAERLLSAHLGTTARVAGQVHREEGSVRKSLADARHAATLILRSQIRVALDDAASAGGAVQDAKSAIKVMEHNASAHRQHIVALAHRHTHGTDQSDALAHAFKPYLRMYPDDALALARAHRLFDHRSVLVVFDDELTRAVRRVSEIYGVQGPGVGHLSSMLTWYRGQAETQRHLTGEALGRAADKNGWLDQPSLHAGPITAWESAESARRHAQRELVEAEAAHTTAAARARSSATAVLSRQLREAGDTDPSPGLSDSLADLATQVDHLHSRTAQQHAGTTVAAAELSPAPGSPPARRLPLAALWAGAAWIMLEAFSWIMVRILSFLSLRTDDHPILTTTSLLQRLVIISLVLFAAYWAFRWFKARSARERLRDAERRRDDLERTLTEIGQARDNLSAALASEEALVRVRAASRDADEIAARRVANYRDPAWITAVGDEAAASPRSLRQHLRARITNYTQAFGSSPRIAVPSARSQHSQVRAGQPVYQNRSSLPAGHWLHHPTGKYFALGAPSSEPSLLLYFPTDAWAAPGVLDAMDRWLAQGPG